MALLFWDANGGTTGTGGAGTWDATALLWRPNSTTGTPLQAWPNGTPSVDEAAFPTAAGIVTVAAGLQIRANKITTQVTGYTIAAGAGGSLQLTGPSPVVSVTTALTISAPFGSDAGFTLAGTTPTLTLSGDLSNLTGTVTIPTGGTVAITRAGTYSLSSSLVLAGTGVLRFTPSAAGSVITLAGTAGDNLDYRFTNTVAGTYTYNYDGFSSPGSAALLTVTHGTAAITTVLNYADAGNRTIASSFTFDVGTAAVAQTLRLSVTGAGNANYASLNKTNTATVASVLELNATSTGVGTLAGITQSAGTLSVNKTGTGTWKLTGAGTHTLPTTLTLGVLEIGHQLAVQNSTVTAVASGGSMTFSSGITAVTFGALSVPSGATFAVPSGVNITYGGNNVANSILGDLTGSGTLTKAGTALQTFGAAADTTAVAFTGTIAVNAGLVRMFDNKLGNTSAYQINVSGPTVGLSHSLNTTNFGFSSPTAMSGVGVYQIKYETSVASPLVSYAPGTFAGLTGTAALTSTGPASGFTLVSQAALAAAASRTVTATVRDFGYRTNFWQIYDLTNTALAQTINYNNSTDSVHNYSNSVINLLTTGSTTLGSGTMTRTLNANQVTGALVLGGLDVAVVAAAHPVNLVLGGTSTAANTVSANFRATPAAGLVLPTTATISKAGAGSWTLSDDDSGTGIGKGLWTALSNLTDSNLIIKTNAAGDSWSFYNASITATSATTAGDGSTGYYRLSRLFLQSGRSVSTDPLNFYFKSLTTSALAEQYVSAPEGLAIPSAPSTVALNIGYSAGLSATNNVVPAAWFGQLLRGNGNLVINYGSASTSTSLEWTLHGYDPFNPTVGHDAIREINLRDGIIKFNPYEHGDSAVGSIIPSTATNVLLPNCTLINILPGTKRLASGVKWHPIISATASIYTVPFALTGNGNFIFGVKANPGKRIRFPAGSLSGFGGDQSTATTTGFTFFTGLYNEAVKSSEDYIQYAEVYELPPAGLVTSKTSNTVANARHTLAYIGTATVGTYDTNFVVNATSTAGTTLSISTRQAAGKKLVLTGSATRVGATGSPIVLNFTGDNTSDNEFSGVISNGAATLTVAFGAFTGSDSFSGRWLLSGANTFTGGVTIEGTVDGVAVAANASAFGGTTGNVVLSYGSIELWQGLNKSGAVIQVYADGQNTVNAPVAGNRRAFLIRDGASVGAGTINCTSINLNTGAYTGFSYAVGFDIVPNYILTINNTAAISGVNGIGLDVDGGGALVFNFNANTYTGPTRVRDGRLSIGIFGGASANSSLGNSTGVASNLKIGTSTTAGVLNIRTASPSAVRAITVGTAGCTVESDASGAVVWSPASAFAFSTPNVACSFTLSGSSTAGNTFNYVLPDNGTGAVDLVKLGTGFWLLQQNPSCTGVTWVREGTFHFNVSTRTLAGNLAIGHLRNVGAGVDYAGAISVQYGTITPLSSVLVCGFTDDIDVAIVLAGTGKTVVFDNLRNYGYTSNSYGVISVTPNSPSKLVATANTISGSGEVKANTIVDLYTEQDADVSGQGKALGNLDMIVSGTIRTKVGTAQQGRMRYGGDLTFQAGSSLVIGG